jgi:P4 family phage/plasmid primase-like protien
MTHPFFTAQGFQPTDLVSMNHTWGGPWKSAIVTVKEATELLPKFANQNLWIGANPLRAGIEKGRGKAEDVMSLRALYADLDVEPSKIPTFEGAKIVIDEVSRILDVEPAVVVMSGHGYQPRWRVAPGPFTVEAAAELMKEFGRLVSHVAAKHGWKVDGVYDLARVLRAPGTTNLKDPEHPVKTTATYAERPQKVTWDQIREALRAHLPKEEVKKVAHVAAVPRQNMSADMRADIAKEVEKILGWIAEDLDKFRNLAPGERIDGKGWDSITMDKTAELASLVKADWNALEVDEAQAFLEKHALISGDHILGATQRRFADAMQKESVEPRPFPSQLDDGWFESVPFDGSSRRERPGSADLDGYTAKMVGDRQFYLDFEDVSAACLKYTDKGDVKGVLPRTTARLLAESTPIAKQPLSKGRAWWTYREGVWFPNDEFVKLSISHSFGDDYQTYYVPPVEDSLSTVVDEITVSPHGDLINFKNGMLEWPTGKLLEHSPDYKSTVQLPHNWNPDAKCPRFDSWLSERLPIDGVKLAWELIAVSLYSGNPIQRAGLLYGVGKSGKSTFLEVIQGLIGDHNTCSLSPQGMSKTVFATHMLLGKQANIVTDIDPTKVSETAIFKQVIASEAISAQQKNKPEFIFRPFCNHLFSANQIPRSSDRTSAWTRRFAILRFDHTLTESVPRVIDRYHEKLLVEAEGIIAKAISVLPALLARGDFSVVQEDQEEFEAATDFTRDFWADAVEITGAREDFVPTNYLARAFDLWCDENSYKVRPVFTDVALFLRDQPLVEGPTRGQLGHGREGRLRLRGYRGVKLSEPYLAAVQWTKVPTTNPLSNLYDGESDDK